MPEAIYLNEQEEEALDRAWDRLSSAKKYAVRNRLKGDFVESEHPRADDGTFGEGGGGKKPASSEQTPRQRMQDEHEARVADWQKRNEAYDERRWAIDEQGESDGLNEAALEKITALEEQHPLESTAVNSPEANEANLAAAKARSAATVQLWAEAYGKDGTLVTRLAALGATAADLMRVVATGERGAAALDKAGQKWVASGEKLKAAGEKLSAHEATEMPDDEDEDRQNAWIEKRSDLQEKFDEAGDIFTENGDKLGEIWSDLAEKISEHTYKVQEKLFERLNDEVEADTEPEEPDYPDEPEEEEPEEPDEDEEPDEPEEEDPASEYLDAEQMTPDEEGEANRRLAEQGSDQRIVWDSDQGGYRLVLANPEYEGGKLTLPGIVKQLRRRLKEGFNESDHPRANDGKFGSGGGGKKPASGSSSHAEADEAGELPPELNLPKGLAKKPGMLARLTHMVQIARTKLTAAVLAVDDTVATSVIPNAYDHARNALLSTAVPGVPINDIAVGLSKVLAWAWSKARSKAKAMADDQVDKVLEFTAIMYEMLQLPEDTPMPSREEIAQSLEAKIVLPSLLKQLQARLKGGDFNEGDHPRADDGKFGSGGGGSSSGKKPKKPAEKPASSTSKPAASGGGGGPSKPPSSVSDWMVDGTFTPEELEGMIEQHRSSAEGLQAAADWLRQQQNGGGQEEQQPAAETAKGSFDAASVPKLVDAFEFSQTRKNSGGGDLGGDGTAYLPELHYRIKKETGQDLPPEQFQRLMTHLRDTGALELHILNETRGLSDKDRALMVSRQAGENVGEQTYGFAMIKDKKKLAAELTNVANGKVSLDVKGSKRLQSRLRKG